jgi:hypothetical protein
MDTENKELQDQIDRVVIRQKKALKWSIVFAIVPVTLAIALLGVSAWQVKDLAARANDLTEKARDLESRKTALVDALDSLVKVIDSSPELKELSSSNPIIRSLLVAEKAKYSIGIYAYNVSANEYEKVKTMFQKEGYANSRGSLLTFKPDWLAEHSTVFYYDNDAINEATYIALELSKSTATKFKISRGAGLGVISGQERWSFYVHYIGE